MKETATSGYLQVEMREEKIEFISERATEINETGDMVTGLCDLEVTRKNLGFDAKLADYSYICSLIDKLAGRSYALIEACVTEKEQQRAFKQSLRGIIDEQRDKAYRELVIGK